MSLKTEHRMPVIMMYLALVICVFLLILPVEQILTTYTIENGVKTVAFVPKAEGVIGLIAVSAVCGASWILLRSWIGKRIAAQPDLLSCRIIKGVINFAFFCWTLLPSLMGVLSIVRWIWGIG